MKVVIDARSLLGRPTTISHYVVNLVRHLAGIDSANDYILFYGAYLTQRTSSLMEVSTSNVTTYRIFLPGRMFHRMRPWSQTLVFNLMTPSREAVVHEPDALQWLAAKKSIVNIHSMVYYTFPDCFPRDDVRRFGQLLEEVARKSLKIVTGSEQVKREIVEFLGVAPDKVVVVHYGVDTDLFRPLEREQIDEIRVSYTRERPYVVSTGLFDPLKNIGVVLKAYAFMQRDSSFLHRLVLLDNEPSASDDVWWTIRNLELEDDITFTGHLADEERARILAGADVAIFPYRSAGFYFLLLEAMACGVPVVTSNIPCCSEIIGSAGSIFDLEDVEGLAAALSGVLNSPTQREKIVKVGIDRAKKFLWDETARRTLKIYEEINARF